MVKPTRKIVFPSLVFVLLLSGLDLQAQTPAEQKPIEIEEAERLQSILRQYYAEEARHDSEVAAGLAKKVEIVELAGENYPLQQVLLSGTQGIKALEHISRRLADNSIPVQRRQSDIIFHAKVRNEGRLLSSRSYSLKSLGKFQYLGMISLPGGEAEVTLPDSEWSLVLPSTETTDYLITLSLLRDLQPELHVIPVTELKATNWSDFPPWLPPIGAMPGPDPGA